MPLIQLNAYPVGQVLKILLQDKTTGGNIIWATNTYEALGSFYAAKDEMTAELVNRNIIQPRISKALDDQMERTKKHAEVFTPAWICNMMNNHCDEVWFGRKDVFNTVDGQEWKPTEGKITFPKRKRWQQYVDSRRLEITCGEAPYLVSRYDAATGEMIPFGKRIGILDRKLRIVNENVDDEQEWMKWTIRAFQSVYGYEYQGDNLLIARINLLMTFADALQEKWQREATLKELDKLANIIMQNLWQMDGLKGTVPLGSLQDAAQQVTLWDLFGDGQQSDDNKRPACVIYDWRGDGKLKFLDRITRKGTEMKFDFVIGNPPYQEEDGGAGKSARPVYQHFVQSAKGMTNTAFSLIIPARWYAGGKGLDDFREEMLEDKHISVLHDYPLTNECFSGVNIRGGVCWFVWQNNYNNAENGTAVITHEKGKETITKRTLKYEGLDVFIRDARSLNILKKVTSASRESLMQHVSSRKPFGLTTDFAKTANFHDTMDGLSDPVRCYGKSLKVGWIEKRFISAHSEWINVYKIMTSRANNIGTELNDDNLNAIVCEPGYVCTESYLLIGADMNLDAISCTNLAKYLKTKFTRFCHSLAKSSQDATAKTYQFVPLQDFTPTSDIEWSASIREIDQQLYKKYNLSQEEIDFIESKVKEMA